MADILIEIGTEELPVPALDALYADLRPSLQKALREQRIPCEEILMEATPRRIAIGLRGVGAQQADQTIEITGPAIEKAYDGEGKPTPALEGFLRSRQAKLSDVTVKETPRGKFVLVRKEEKGQLSSKLVPALVERILLEFPFPKKMRWDASGCRFPRPVRWIVALCDKKNMKMALGTVKASNQTLGHRFLAPKPFKIASADWTAYGRLLKKAHVLLSLEERKKLIRGMLARNFSQPRCDEELVHWTANLVEEPWPLSGRFAKAYLDLPAEVLASSMKKHQKIFACYDGRGKLDGRFVAILNGRRKNPSKIARDYENVLESRLRDARFFVEEDLKSPLSAKVEKLGQVNYLGKLGTLYDKTERLKKLAAHFVAIAGLGDLGDALGRAAHLSKADLLTQLVYEFPELQGIAGREYALKNGETAAVAAAVGAHYLPKNLAEPHTALKQQIPLLGAMLGLIDRADLVAGAFSIGLDPTGSQDPYALRRAGGTIVKLVRAFGFRFSVSSLIEAALANYREKILAKEPVTGSEVSVRILQFLRERLVAEAGVTAGTRDHEILNAVLRASADDWADVFLRFEALQTMNKEDPVTFGKAVKIVERASNILKGEKAGSRGVPGPVQVELLAEPAEKELYETLRAEEKPILEDIQKGRYRRATERFAAKLSALVHRFFEEVLVNAEDPALRANRHALMRQIHGLYGSRIADLSLLSKLDVG